MIEEEIDMEMKKKAGVKEITIETWRNKAKKLKESYKNIEKLKEDASKKIGIDYYYITDVPTINMIMVKPYMVIEYGKDDERIHLSRDSVFYYSTKGNDYEKLDTIKIIDALVEKIVPHISVEQLVKDVLYDATPEDLKEMFERAIIKEGKIKEKPGCYKMLFGGKPGAPFEFCLRE